MCGTVHMLVQAEEKGVVLANRNAELSAAMAALEAQKSLLQAQVSDFMGACAVCVLCCVVLL